MKYLITSDYQYYDDFAFSNVCICDTKERAEELVKEFNENKEIFKNTLGYEIYLDKDGFEETIFSDFEYINISPNVVRVFLNLEIFEQYKDTVKECNIYYEETNLYNFLNDMYWNNKSDDIRCRYLNHEEAVLSIHEIPYL